MNKTTSRKTPLTHVGADGRVTMVDVSRKQVLRREAKAAGKISLQPETLRLIDEDRVAKGNVLATARIAGIQAAKRTAELIPLCHSLQLAHVQLDFETTADGIGIESSVITTGQTGAEMEALAAVSVAALTIYDMCKAVDQTMRIGEIRLLKKTKTPPAGATLR